jgi:hypothetical protein
MGDGGNLARPHRPNEPRALSALAFRELRGFPGAMRDMHLGIAGRAFRGTGSASRPIQRRLLGDTLVLVPSASGRGRTRRIPFKDEHGHHVGATHHLALLNHPEVYERLRGWLTHTHRERPPAA